MCNNIAYSVGYVLTVSFPHYIIALIDLSKKLKVLGLNMPQQLHFQFDNCGENKVSSWEYSVHYTYIIQCLISCLSLTP
jgi:hypothetical protein